MNAPQSEPERLDAPVSSPDQPDDVEHTTAIPPTDRHDPAPTRRRLSVGHLVAGLVFLGIAAMWAGQESGVISAGDTRLLVPLLLVVVGLGGLIAGLRTRD